MFLSGSLPLSAEEGRCSSLEGRSSLSGLLVESLRVMTSTISVPLPFFDKEWSRARSLHDLARLVRMVIEIQTSTNHKKEEAVCGYASGRCFSDSRPFLPALFSLLESCVFSRQRMKGLADL
jgi:hypothetical protein